MNDNFLNVYFKKKRIIFLRGLIFLIITLLLVLSISELSQNSSKYIAKIEINELILSNPKLLKKIEDISEDNNLKGVLVSVNSPGGTVVSSQQLYKALINIGKNVPIVVSMKEVAASGGYMVSLAANKIFCFEGTITGSVGVILQSANIENLLTKLGVKPLIYKSGSLKAVPNPIEEETPEGKSSIKRVIDNMFIQFIGLVNERRKISKENLELISDGRIFTGVQAKEINLIDEIGTENDALNWLKEFTNSEKDISIINIKEEETILNLFNMSKLNNLFNKNLVLTSGIFALWSPYYE